MKFFEICAEVHPCRSSVTRFLTKSLRKLRNTSDGAERVMDTMQQMARSFSTRLVQMGMAYESTVESADNRNLFQKLQS